MARVLITGTHPEYLSTAMLDAIAGARETITFETYIYWSGDIGQKFADALSERARREARQLFAEYYADRAVEFAA